MTQPTKLSTWANNIAPSPTLAVDAKAKELKAAGEDVCGFGAGEPDFDTPEFIKEACIRAIQEGKTKYAPAPGIPALREALAEKYRNQGVDGTTAAQCVVSPGGKYSCYLAILAVISPGDEVVIPAPYWVSYPEMVKLAGGIPKTIFAGLENGFKITPEQLREAITPKTRLLIINSPSNPTGAIYSAEELQALTEVALEAGVYIMSDEIYEYLLYDGVKHVSPASFSKEAADAVITVAGFSKTFSMTGWRLGTLMAPLAVAKAVANLQSQTSSNATTFAQYGALAAMQNWDQSMAAVNGMLEVSIAAVTRSLRVYKVSMESTARAPKVPSISFRILKSSDSVHLISLRAFLKKKESPSFLARALVLPVTSASAMPHPTRSLKKALVA
jgi:aspartate aminotransferase